MLAEQVASPNFPACPSSPGHGALLSSIEAVRPSRVVVLGEDSLEILCALIRLGCASASEVCPAERPEPHSAELVAATMPQSRANLDHLLKQASRALVPGGWLLLEVHGPAAGTRARHGVLLLQRSGYSVAGSEIVAGVTILRARLVGG